MYPESLAEAGLLIRTQMRAPRRSGVCMGLTRDSKAKYWGQTRLEEFWSWPIHPDIAPHDPREDALSAKDYHEPPCDIRPGKSINKL